MYKTRQHLLDGVMLALVIIAVWWLLASDAPPHCYNDACASLQQR